MVQSRELFWLLSPTLVGLFYLVATAAACAFVAGLTVHVLRYRRAAPAGIAVDWRAGLRRMVADVTTQRTLARRDRYAGVAHRLIFYGFATLFVGTAIVTLDHDITRPLIGWSFWHGWFYLGFKLVMNIAGLALVIGLLMMIVRRGWFHLAKLDYVRRYRGDTAPTPNAKRWQIEDWIFICLLLLIALSGFVQEATRLMIDRPQLNDLSPVAAALASLLSWLGLGVHGAAKVRAVNWWMHGALAFTFIGTMTWTKGKHIVAAFGSLAARDPHNVTRLPAVAQGSAAGVQRMRDFSWRDLMHLDACTKCGRCHEACPARESGYPLSPRDLILDLRLLAQRHLDADPHGVIAADTLWACRTCGACAEICPVGVEHPVKIVKMRRELVDRGVLDPILRGVLETIGNTGNSFGEASRKRGAWTRELEFPVKDARSEPVDALWFVGDFASFDPRSQRVSQTVARLFRAGGLDFGILFDGERTAGNDVRRAGEEGLFEALREHNLEVLGQSRFNWIVTTDPHSLNTLRNEYGQGQAPRQQRVLHYTNVLADWLEGGQLKVTRPLRKRVTLHDPCHLGRLNKEYDAPRRVLRAIGCEIVEMPRSRDNSFCCGAGGGRIWIPDAPGTRKPAHSRMDEAAALGRIDVFVTCCPKDLTMFEDARKGSGHEGDFVVADIAELVAEAVELKAIPADYLPQLAERIAQSLAARVADQVIPRLIDALAARVLPAGMAAEVAQPQPVSPLVAGSELLPAATLPDTIDNGSTTPWSVKPVSAVQLADYARPDKNGMRILVAIKHVGKLGDEFEFLADGTDVRPDDLEHQLNEFDETALEAAMQLVERAGQGEVIAVTIGDAAVETSLRKALAKGAHRGVRIWGEGIQPSDPVSVAACLAGVVALEQPDIVLTGVQSSDFGNGSTASALGGMLGWAHAAVVVGIKWDGQGHIDIVRELEGGVRHVQGLPAPAVLSIQAGANTPRYATMRMIKDAKSKPVAETAPVDAPSAGARTNALVRPPVGQATMIDGSAEEVAARVGAIIRGNTKGN